LLTCIASVSMIASSKRSWSHNCKSPSVQLVTMATHCRRFSWTWTFSSEPEFWMVPGSPEEPPHAPDPQRVCRCSSSWGHVTLKQRWPCSFQATSGRTILGPLRTPSPLRFPRVSLQVCWLPANRSQPVFQGPIRVCPRGQ